MKLADVRRPLREREVASFVFDTNNVWSCMEFQYLFLAWVIRDQI
jgi:hypothetical protein